MKNCVRLAIVLNMAVRYRPMYTAVRQLSYSVAACHDAAFVIIGSWPGGHYFRSVCLFVTGSIARSAKLPAFNLLRGRF